MSSGITQYICAVDGGGTGCRALIARRDGTVLATSTGGPANYTTDPAQAAQSVQDVLRAAARQLDSTPPLNTMVGHVGLAGILNREDENDLAGRLPLAACTVSDDRKISALGVLGARSGAVLAIGTGSFMVVRKGETMAFFGGWGLQVGDQASGAWLGREVLEQTLLAHDGLARHSDLTHGILAHFQETPTRIALFAAKATPSEFATFAPEIVSAAHLGDAVGRRLMKRGADYLSRCLASARLSAADSICLTGGVGPHYEPYLEKDHRALLCPPAGTALDGALQLAREKLAVMEAKT